MDQPRPTEDGPAHPVVVVRGSATTEELHAVQRAVARRRTAAALARWRSTRRAALRRHPEAGSDR